MENQDKRKRKTTAFQASREIHRILHDDEGGLYEPWQYAAYLPIPVTLETTYEEIFILWQEEARFREGFLIEDQKIYIPHLFAKISGTHRNLKNYWHDLIKLTENQERTVFIKGIPMMAPVKWEQDANLLNDEGCFHIDRVKGLKAYTLGFLKESVQDLLLLKLNKLLQSKNIFKFIITEELKYKALYGLFRLDRQILNLIQKFDFSAHIPKLVIYDGADTAFTQEDFFMIALLQLCCFDIILFTPSGYSNLERGIHADSFQIHNLEELRLGLTLPDQDQKDKEHWLKRFLLWFYT
ncbi:YceG family protein [Alkaliphilus crotonatoxidans]